MYCRFAPIKNNTFRYTDTVTLLPTATHSLYEAGPALLLLQQPVVAAAVKICQNVTSTWQQAHHTSNYNLNFGAKLIHLNGIAFISGFTCRGEVNLHSFSQVNFGKLWQANYFNRTDLWGNAENWRVQSRESYHISCRKRVDGTNTFPWINQLCSSSLCHQEPLILWEQASLI